MHLSNDATLDPLLLLRDENWTDGDDGGLSGRWNERTCHQDEM